MQCDFLALDNAPNKIGVAVSLLQNMNLFYLVNLIWVADVFDTSRTSQFFSYVGCRLEKAILLETRRLRNQPHGERIDEKRHVCPHLPARCALTVDRVAGRKTIRRFDCGQYGNCVNVCTKNA